MHTVASSVYLTLCGVESLNLLGQTCQVNQVTSHSDVAKQQSGSRAVDNAACVHENVLPHALCAAPMNDMLSVAASVVQGTAASEAVFHP